MLDAITIEVSGGTGGHGLTSFHREKFIPNGGPDGGDGGRGGRVLLRAVDDVYTLEKYRAKRKFRAGDGGNGGSKLRHGANGSDLHLDVPAGTVVFDDETGDLVADFSRTGEEMVVAFGGRGGWGNKRFASSTNQAPHYSQKGHAGERVELRLELRLLADVGLIGLPNAGKSTLLSAISNAKPKIAAYPFTTLEPMLGVVNVRYDRFTVADLPGLVEGASEGYGLGFEFLKHVRRCRVLLHLVDSTSPDPVTDFELIEEEVRTYERRLEGLPRVVALTKQDLLEDVVEMQVDALQGHLGREVHVISAETGEGLPPLLDELLELVNTEKVKAEQEEPEELPVLRPASQQRFEVTRAEDGRFLVEGHRVVSFVEMMDTDMEGARDEIDRRLERWGVAKALRKAGIGRGDTVVFGDTELEWVE